MTMSSPAAARAASSLEDADSSVTRVAMAPTSVTIAFMAVPIFEPSAMTTTRADRSMARRWISASPSSSSVSPHFALRPPAPMMARSKRKRASVAAATGPTHVSSSRRTAPPRAITSTGRVPSRLAVGSDAVTTTRPGRAGRNRANCSAVVPIPTNTTRASASRRVARIPIRRFSRVCWRARALNATSSARVRWAVAPP